MNYLRTNGSLSHGWRIVVVAASVYYLRAREDSTGRTTFGVRHMCPPPSVPTTDQAVDDPESGAVSEAEPDPPIAHSPIPTAISPSAGISQPSLHPGDLVEINQADVNCRAWMSTAAPVRSKLKKGARALVMGEPIRFDKHTWYKVQPVGTAITGFVSDRYLTLIERAAETIQTCEPSTQATPDEPGPYRAGDLLTTTANIFLRAGPGKTEDVISGLGPSARGTVLGEPVTIDSMAWVPVRFPAGSGWIAARLTRRFRQEGKWIEADLTTQALHAWVETACIASSPISSGKPGFSTPPGTYAISRKIPIQRLRGDVRDETWDIPGVPWIMIFREGGFYIHSVYWHEDFGTPASHGCVTLPVDFAEWLYDWTPLGTQIWIHE